MNLLIIVGLLLFLLGLWVYERLPRWRAADARARREPLTDEQFGQRFFPPDLSRIAARLKRLASEQLGKDLTRLHPDDLLAQTLSDDFDSLDSVELLLAIEDELGIELDDAVVADIKTFRDFVTAVAARRWPPLVRPQWMSWVVCGVPFLSAAVVAISLPSFADRAFRAGETVGFLMSFASELRVLVAIAVATGTWILLVRVSKHFNRALPCNLRTVGDLVPFVMTSTEMTWTRDQIEDELRRIVVTQLQAPMEHYQAGGRFVEDLRMEPNSQSEHLWIT